MLQSIRKYPVLNLDTPEKTKVIPDAYFWPFHVIQSFSTEISINIEYWKWSGNVLFDSSCSRKIDNINKSRSILLKIYWSLENVNIQEKWNQSQKRQAIFDNVDIDHFDISYRWTGTSSQFHEIIRTISSICLNFYYNILITFSRKREISLDVKLEYFQRLKLFQVTVIL